MVCEEDSLHKINVEFNKLKEFYDFFLDNIVVKLKLMIYNVVFLIMNNTVLVELKIERRKMA